MAPRQEVTAKIACVAPQCQTWQLMPDNFSSSCTILMISSAKEKGPFLAFLTFLTRLIQDGMTLKHEAAYFVLQPLFFLTVKKSCQVFAYVTQKLLDAVIQ